MKQTHVFCSVPFHGLINMSLIILALPFFSFSFEELVSSDVLPSEEHVRPGSYLYLVCIGSVRWIFFCLFVSVLY
jgi:hypothetical protein